MTTPIPQPPARFLLGNVNEIDPDRFLQSLQRLEKLYGSIYKLDILGNRIVVISSQEIVNMACDESKFDKKIGLALVELRAVSGDGLFTAHTSEPNWKLAHNILIPAFGPQAIRNMFPEMMDILSQLILRWERFVGEEIDICDNFTRLTLDTIALCSFNYRFNSFYREKMHSFVDSMVNVLIESGKRVQRLALQQMLMIGTNRRFNDDIAVLHGLCDEIVKQRREHPNDVNDLLNRMINGKDSVTGYQLSDENIRYQMITFLVAGHETTSGLLSFAFYYLLKNPNALQKAQFEVDQYDEITIDTLSKLKYIDAVLKETLRLQSTAILFALQSKNDKTILPGGYEISKDDTILVLLSQLHRDPKIWDRPEEFLPERMLNGGFENLPENAWKPFGNGQRSCIGRPFAMQESLLAVAMILKHFYIDLVDPSYDLRIKQNLTIKPDGFKIKVRSRQHVKILLDTKIKQEKVIPNNSTGTNENKSRSISILFGSNAGSCESFAAILASEAPKHGFSATINTLDSAIGSLVNDRPVIIITSSYEGKPCDNAKQFVAYLASQPTLNIQYAVFGAGHHDWVSTYQKIPIYIDEMLEKAGGIKIIDRGVGDSAGDFFGSFEAWKENLFKVLRHLTGVESAINDEMMNIELIHSSRNRGEIIDMGFIKENQVLTEASELGPTKRHIEIELPKGQTYRVGDYLAVLPRNPTQLVHRVLKRFNLSIDAQIKIHSLIDTFLPTGAPVNVFEILSGYVELTQPISRKQLETVAALCKNENEQRKLVSLGNDSYQTEILDKHLSILDILELNSSCELPFSQYLRMLPSLRVRQYSISSSPLWNAEVVTLTLDVIDALAFSKHGRYYGVASNYLSNLKKGDRLNCTVRASDAGFHLPEDTKIPVVMFAAGTGIAPFRGFIQERAAQIECGREVGPMILYFGCRSSQDFLYSNELNRWLQLGVVQVKTVFSRQSENDRKYVQHLVWDDRQEIVRLFHSGARFYTCGSATKLAGSLKTCLIKIIAEEKQCDEKAAVDIFENISVNRYNVDVFI
ncbi:unnamed protein product [Rotaria socialis]|uniref:NADPH--cytochrome P450 reductase n=1 Tax=Rotaria socialis TaxID=392032 RepID=A0A817P2S3_9BILA|nr:unnamed protein product [Rotaria socialis]CAF4363854.1 unnamed protein product [Rotaria socialis]